MKQALLVLPLLVSGCVAARGQGPAGGADSLALRQIRVLVYNGGQSADVAVRGPCRILDPAGNVLFESPSLSGSVAINPRGEAVLLNGRALPDGARLVPRAGAGIEVPGGTYRGTLRLLNRQGRLQLVNDLDVEDYLQGVLPGELFAHFHVEAYKAQAVAARTYALYQKFANPGPDYDVTNTQASQVYKGLADETPKSVDAVRATHGRVLTWTSPAGEQLFCTYYSSTCGGLTNSVSNFLPVAATPPLAGGVRCDACGHSKYHTWPAVAMSRADVTARLRARHPLFLGMGTIVRVDPLEVSPEGRLVWLRLVDNRGQAARMRGTQFRLAVGPALMRSTWCAIDNTPGGFVFRDGRGFGHGVGLCQYGADGYAQRGWTWRQILLHYYPNSHITKAY